MDQTENHFTDKFINLKITIPQKDIMHKRQVDEIDCSMDDILNQRKRSKDNKHNFTFDKPLPLIVEPFKPLTIETIETSKYN
jgi:hypothetical protein